MSESDAPSLLLTDTENEFLRDTEQFAVLPLAFIDGPFAQSIDVEVKDEVCQSDRSQDSFDQDPHRTNDRDNKDDVRDSAKTNSDSHKETKEHQQGVKRRKENAESKRIGGEQP